MYANKVFGTPKQPPLSGHKCLGARLAVEVNCECGWVSCPHTGDHARAAAYSEWRDHVRTGHDTVAKNARDEVQG